MENKFGKRFIITIVAATLVLVSFFALLFTGVIDINGSNGSSNTNTGNIIPDITIDADKLALKQVSEDKKFGSKLKDLFGNVSYKTKRIILDRLIVHCINKITESQTKDYLKSLIEDSPIFVRTKKIENLLKYEYHLKNEPDNFLKQRLEITNILNKLYHPNTNPIVNEETINLQNPNLKFPLERDENIVLFYQKR